jgi:hypothetical protein
MTSDEILKRYIEHRLPRELLYDLDEKAGMWYSSEELITNICIIFKELKNSDTFLGWLENKISNYDKCLDMIPKTIEKDEQRKKIHEERMHYVECKLKYLGAIYGKEDK